MIDLTYSLQGVEQVQQRLLALASLRGLDGELEASGDEIVNAARDYPPERPGQRYRRSERLKRGWRRSDARHQASTVVVDVTNDTPYGLFVQGDAQAEVHRGRWKKLRTIGEEQRGALRARAQAWALRVWRGR